MKLLCSSLLVEMPGLASALVFTLLPTVTPPLWAQPTIVANEMAAEIGDLTRWPPYVRLRAVPADRRREWADRLALDVGEVTRSDRILAAALTEILQQADKFRACDWVVDAPASVSCYEAWFRYYVGGEISVDEGYRIASAARHRPLGLSAGPAGGALWVDLAPMELIRRLEGALRAADLRVRARGGNLFPVSPHYDDVALLVGAGGPPATYVGVTLDGTPQIRVDTTTARWWRGVEVERIVAHEIWPGHHLLATAPTQELNPLLRGYQSPGTVEGWATYAEVIATTGWRADDSPEIRSHLSDLALLAQVDIGINHRKWSTQAAADTLLAGAPYSPAQADRVVASMRLRPGRQASYYLGFALIVRLREESVGRLGDTFQEQDFHRRLLQYGALPFEALRALVLDDEG